MQLPWVRNLRHKGLFKLEWFILSLFSLKRDPASICSCKLFKYSPDCCFHVLIIPLGSSSYGLPVSAAAAEVWGTQCYRRPARLHDLARWEDLGKICAVAFQSFAHHPCCLSPNTEAWSSLPRWPPNLPVLFWLYEPGLNVSIVNPMIEMYFDCPFHLCCSFPPPPPPLYPSLLLFSPAFEVGDDDALADNCTGFARLFADYLVDYLPL